MSPPFAATTSPAALSPPPSLSRLFSSSPPQLAAPPFLLRAVAQSQRNLAARHPKATSELVLHRASPPFPTPHAFFKLTCRPAPRPCTPSPSHPGATPPEPTRSCQSLSSPGVLKLLSIAWSSPSRRHSPELFSPRRPLRCLAVAAPLR